MPFLKGNSQLRRTGFISTAATLAALGKNLIE